MGVAVRMAVLAGLNARREAALRMTPRTIAFVNARLVDPESGYDGPGCLVVSDGTIADVIRRPALDAPSPDLRVIDCGGALLAPGLIDIRVKTGEPGAEPKETLKSAARAAAAGGVTSIVLQPDTDPAIDDPAMIGFLLRRAREIDLVHVYAAGAATRRCEGEALAEIGLMQEAGALYITDAGQAHRQLARAEPGPELRPGAGPVDRPPADRPLAHFRNLRHPRANCRAASACRPRPRWPSRSAWSATWRWPS